MKVAIVSLFRDNAEDVKRLFVERSQWQWDQKKLVHICVEGDSADDTHEQLQKVAKGAVPVIVEKLDQGNPKFGSVIEPSRLQVLARLWNRGLDIAVAEKADYTFLLDSDLSVGADVLPRLVSTNKDVVAPMMFIESTIYFRDTWGYHKDGNDFLNKYPYHKSYLSNKPFEVDGVGCPLMKYQVLASGVRCDDNEVRGLSTAIKKKGYKIFVNPFCSIYHPRVVGDIPPDHER